MGVSSSCVAIFSKKLGGRASILNTLEALISLDYSVYNLSVLGSGLSQKNDIFIDQVHFKGEQSNFLEGLWHLLGREVFLYIPTFGFLTVMGGLSSIFMDENERIFRTDEYSQLGRVLHRIGIPARSISYYESLLKKGKLMLIINGNNFEVENACNILEGLVHCQEVSLHFVNTGYD